MMVFICTQKLKAEKEVERAGLEEHKAQIVVEKKRQTDMAEELARVARERETEEKRVLQQLKTIDAEKKATQGYHPFIFIHTYNSAMDHSP
jgi:hypothetical protein